MVKWSPHFSAVNVSVHSARQREEMAWTFVILNHVGFAFPSLPDSRNSSLERIANLEGVYQCLRFPSPTTNFVTLLSYCSITSWPLAIRCSLWHRNDPLIYKQSRTRNLSIPWSSTCRQICHFDDRFTFPSGIGLYRSKEQAISICECSYLCPYLLLTMAYQITQSQRDRRIYVNEPAAVTPEYLICFQLPTMAS